MESQNGARGPRALRIDGSAGAVGCSRRVLEGALAPFAGAGPLAEEADALAFAEPVAAGGVLPGPGNAVLQLPVTTDEAPIARPVAPGATVGWVRGMLPAPFEDDRYLVEFAGDDEVRVLAYLDRFGRAFVADEPSEVPPARVPDLAFVRDDAVAPDADEAGWAVVPGEGGEARRVAAYRVSDGLYDLFDSWYDFGEDGCGLTYADALARAYLACVHRPSLTGIPVPSSGLGCIFELLGAANPVRGLRAVRLLVERARRDPALRPPALASLLVEWLEEAGFTERASRGWLYGADDDGPLRLIRTRRYADTFYLGRADEGADVAERTIWAVESALNRFLLVAGILGSQAPQAGEAACAVCDAELRAGISVQAGDAAHPADADDPQPAGEWAARVAVAQALERLRLPYRFRATFDLDVAEPGVAAFAVTAPDASLMPRHRHDAEQGRWVELTGAEREDEARAYATRLAIVLAAAAFSATRAIGEVMVTVRPLGSAADVPADGDADGGELFSWDEAAALALAADGELAAGGSPADDGALFFQVVFDRMRFTAQDACRTAALETPVAFLASFDAVMGADADAAGPGPRVRAPFCLLEGRPSQAVRADVPECADVPLDAEQQRALGARSARDLRVAYDGRLRRVADELADAVAGTGTVQAAIREVRAVQDATGDPLVYQGCTRLMTALTQGTVAPADRGAVRACLVGESALADAAGRARAVLPADPQRAADILDEALAEAESSGRFVDTGEAVHRFFDGYASRLAYNLLAPDGDREVELAPPALLLCYLDAINLLDESFSRSEAAVAYGRRCIELAPTFALAYRRCARAYMLVGDLESAADLLVRCLAFATAADEIALAYYQLAYVEWKAGRPREGLACYCKSIMASPVYAPQASVELHELMREEGLGLMPREQVDDVLDAAGIPVAPVGDRLVELEAALRAAVDANLFAVGRALLAAFLQHRPDDALASVLRSLGAPSRA